MKVNSGRWIRARHGGKGGLSLGGFGGSVLGVGKILKRKMAWLAAYYLSVCLDKKDSEMMGWS